MLKKKVIMITTTIMKTINIYGKTEKINLTMMDQIELKKMQVEIK